MRAYHFVNMYTAGIHTGIQGGHARDELWLQMLENLDGHKAQMFLDWARNHKTHIYLGGGDCDGLQATVDLFTDTPYPMATFNESIGALNGALTSMCVILPPQVYMLKEFKRQWENTWAETKAANLSAVRRYEKEYGKVQEIDFTIGRALMKYPLAR